MLLCIAKELRASLQDFLAGAAIEIRKWQPHYRYRATFLGNAWGRG